MESEERLSLTPLSSEVLLHGGHLHCQLHGLEALEEAAGSPAAP